MKSIAQLQAELPALLNPTAAPARVEAYLDELAAQCERVEANSNDYPNNPISGDVWRDGYALVQLGAQLSAALEEREPEELWLRALGCWSTAVFAVVAHYRAEVGPLMHAALRYHRRRGDEAAVLEKCRAIVADFTVLLEEAEALQAEDENAFAGAIDNELLAIAYLEMAVRVLSAAGDAKAAQLLHRLQLLPPYWMEITL